MKKLKTRLQFELRQWSLRKIKRNEESTRRVMKNLDLDYEDVNLRLAKKVEADEMWNWLEKNMIN